MNQPHEPTSATGVLSLSKPDQIRLWTALTNPPAPTPEQVCLGQLVRSVMRNSDGAELAERSRTAEVEGMDSAGRIQA